VEDEEKCRERTEWIPLFSEARLNVHEVLLDAVIVSFETSLVGWAVAQR
jgi:hypothetical protein